MGGVLRTLVAGLGGAVGVDEVDVRGVAVDAYNALARHGERHDRTRPLLRVGVELGGHEFVLFAAEACIHVDVVTLDVATQTELDVVVGAIVLVGVGVEGDDGFVGALGGGLHRAETAEGYEHHQPAPGVK